MIPTPVPCSIVHLTPGSRMVSQARGRLAYCSANRRAPLLRASVLSGKLNVELRAQHLTQREARR